MSSDQIAISVQNISKRFELYQKPSDHLRQLLLPKIHRMMGVTAKNYFQEFWALRDISFEVKKGESFGIVGRNGSGKSTLLQIITGTLFPTSGSVSTQGRVAALLELGSGFNPEFSGRENVFINGALLGLTKEKVEQKFDAIAAFADIGTHLEQPIKSYSSGMLVRLAIAIQIQLEPDILIIDEALAVGDALFQKRCYRQIQKLLDNGCTLLFVSHDQEIVRTLTDRAIFLNKGHQAKYGATSDVLFDYREFLQREEEAAFADMQFRTQVQSERKVLADQTSYGNLDVEILRVDVLDGAGQPCNLFYAGDGIRFQVECICNVDIENLNVAFRVLSKEGIKVTTWGTLNEDMQDFETRPQATFWDRKFAKGEKFTVTFEGHCALAANLYELQIVVAREYDRYYADQRVLHWRDEAAHFTVILRNNYYVFDGICDMGLRSRTLSNDLVNQRSIANSSLGRPS